MQSFPIFRSLTFQWRCINGSILLFHLERGSKDQLLSTYNAPYISVALNSLFFINLLAKTGNSLEHLTNQDMQMRHAHRCSISVVVREMQIKSSVDTTLYPFEWLKFKRLKTPNDKGQGYGAIGTPTHFWRVCKWSNRFGKPFLTKSKYAYLMIRHFHPLGVCLYNK